MFPYQIPQTGRDNNSKRDQEEKFWETDTEKQQITFKIHTVKPGETLGTIAKTYYEDYNRIALIAEFNNIKDFDQIKVGQKIVV